MKANKTHSSFVIDRSGSMSAQWSDVRGGYAQFVKDQKKEPGEFTFSLLVFDTELEYVENFKDIQEVSEDLKAFPRGGTALYDAIGKIIVETGQKLSEMKEEDRPEKVVVLIQTDGQENSSREYTLETVKEMMRVQREVYNWEFLFLGANEDALKGAVNLGMSTQNFSTYGSAASMTSGLSAKMSQVRSMSLDSYHAGGASFTDEEKALLNEE